jgi:hypothetical protein
VSAINADGQGPETFPWRIRDLERFKDWVERWQREDFTSWQRDVDDDRRDLEYVRKDVQALRVSVDSLRKTIIAFAFSVAGSAVVFGLSVLIATGKV